MGSEPVQKLWPKPQKEYTMMNRRSVIGILLLVLFILVSGPGEEQTWENLHYGNNFLSFHVLPENPTLEGVFQDKLPWFSRSAKEKSPTSWRTEPAEI